MSDAVLDRGVYFASPMTDWYRERPFKVALAVSVVVHAVLIALIPGLRSVPIEMPRVLDVEIVPTREPAVALVQKQSVAATKLVEPKPEAAMRQPQPELPPLPRTEIIPAPRAVPEPELAVPRPELRPEPKAEPRQQARPEPTIAPRPEPAPVARVEPRPEPALRQPQPEPPPLPRTEIIPAARAVAAPELAVPRPELRPEPKAELRPQARPEPTIAPRPEPPPVARVEPRPEPSPEPITQIGPALVASAPPLPVASAPPPPVAAAQPQAVVPKMDEAHENRLLATYGQSISKEIKRFQNYPAPAQRRGWQGTAEILLKIAADGKVTAIILAKSSGYAVLDEEALRMVRRVSSLPQAPADLRGRALVVSVPIVFRLQDS